MTDEQPEEEMTLADVIEATYRDGLRDGREDMLKLAKALAKASKDLPTLVVCLDKVRL